MLTPSQITLLRKELKNSQRPLFFYDDDPDGLCSFLLLYRINREGMGVVVKSLPIIDMSFFGKVESYSPDKIFILDVPSVQQEFIDKVKRPIFWIDHHKPLNLKKIKYYNPRKKKPDIYIPTSRMAFQVNGSEDDLWLGAVGCLADYYIPDFLEKFIEKYPNLLSKKEELPVMLYERPIVKLIRIFSFLLKGDNKGVYQNVKILTRIKSPDEIMEQTTSQGKFLYQTFEKLNSKYEKILNEAKKAANKSKILLFEYTEQDSSFTSDIANELSSLYSDKVILIAREKSGEMKCSLRAKINIAEKLAKALQGIEGYGGGHPNACGAVIKKKDWEQFLKNLRDEVK